MSFEQLFQFEDFSVNCDICDKGDENANIFQCLKIGPEIEPIKLVVYWFIGPTNQTSGRTEKNINI